MVKAKLCFCCFSEWSANVWEGWCLPVSDIGSASLNLVSFIVIQVLYLWMNGSNYRVLYDFNYVSPLHICIYLYTFPNGEKNIIFRLNEGLVKAINYINRYMHIKIFVFLEKQFEMDSRKCRLNSVYPKCFI